MSIKLSLVKSRNWLLISSAVTVTALLMTILVLVVKGLALNQVDGVWLSADGTKGRPDCLNIENTASPADENRIGFGVPASFTETVCPSNLILQPGFGFDGNDISNVFEPSAPFVLGEFTHYNRQSKPLTGTLMSNLRRADLQINLDFTDPPLSTAFTYTINLTNTENIITPQNPNCCPDIVSFVDTFPTQIFLISNTQYTLQVIGFISPTVASECVYDSASIINMFVTEENADSTACLFARVIVKNPTLSVKTAPDLKVATIGDTINYTITIANIGDTKLNNVIVNNPTLNIINQSIGDLEIGAAHELHRSYGPITQSHLAGVINTTTATATTPEGVAVGPFTGGSTVPVAALTLTKSAYFGHNSGTSCPGSHSIYAATDAPITYCFGVTNIGSANLANITLVDSDLGITLTEPQRLPPSGSFMLSSEAIVSGDLLNTARAAATVVDADGNPMSGAHSPRATDTAEVKVISVQSLTPQISTNDVNTVHTVTATVVDDPGNPFFALPVNFVVRGANSRNGISIPDTKGQAVFTYTGTITGTDFIAAWVELDGDVEVAPESIDPGEPQQSATATWNTVYSTTLTQSTSTTFTGLEHTIIASVTNHLKQPISGLDLFFDVKGTHPMMKPTKIENGLATLTYKGTISGTDTIGAWIDLSNPGVRDGHEPYDEVNLTWNAVQIVAIMSVNNVFNIGSKNIISAYIRGANDDTIRVPDLAVNFAVTGTNPFTDVQTSGPSGQVTFVYTGTNNIVTATAELTDNIILWIDFNEDQIPNGIEPTVTLIAGWLPISMTVTGSVTGTEQVATRTMTVTIENSQRQRVNQLDAKVGFNVSGGTSYITEPAPFSGGQIVFKYTSIAPFLSIVQAAAGAQTPSAEEQLNAPQVCDEITIWVDLNGNKVFDPGNLLSKQWAEPAYKACIITAIKLLSFAAQTREDGTVHLSWQTATEIDNAGFNIYRSSYRNGPYEKINERLIAANGSIIGAGYEYIDTVLVTLPIYYKLEDIDYEGISTFHGPIRIPSELIPDGDDQNSRLYLPLIQR